MAQNNIQLPTSQKPLTPNGMFTAAWNNFFFNVWQKLNGETPSVLPPGGAKGQVLVKESPANYNVGWETLATVANTGEATDLKVNQGGILLGNQSGVNVQNIGVGAGLSLVGNVLTATGQPISIPSGDILANLQTHDASPVGNTLSSILDFVLGSVIGSGIFRGASGWGVIVPVTAGFILTDNGVGFTPSYQTPEPYTLLVPVTGFSATIGNLINWLILDPAGTLATGTVIMPASPYDGMEVGIASTQTITALTHSPNIGQTLNGALTTIAPNTAFKWKYSGSNKTWYVIT